MYTETKITKVSSKWEQEEKSVTLIFMYRYAIRNLLLFRPLQCNMTAKRRVALFYGLVPDAVLAAKPFTYY